MNVVNNYIVILCMFLLQLTNVSCNNIKNASNILDDEVNELERSRIKMFCVEMLNLLNDSANVEVVSCKDWFEQDETDLLWVGSVCQRHRFDTLVDILSRVDEHGLSPELFYVDRLRRYYENCKKENSDIRTLAKLELTATLAYLKYCRALQYGIIDTKVDIPGHHVPLQGANSHFFQQCLDNATSDLLLFCERIEPKQADYLALQQARRVYKTFSDSLIQKVPLLPGKKTIKLNSHDSLILQIKNRLLSTGELDNVSDIYMRQTLFDEKLLVALNKLRYKNGLLLDNEIGNQTIKALNQNFTDYINCIDVNMERLRWKQKDSLPSKHIRVNVANMELKAYRADTLAIQMRVVVGKPPLTKTPLLRSAVYEILLNPTWTVPNSIVVKEIAPLMMRDTTYLRRQKMRVFYKKVEQRPDTIKWSRISKNYQPYIIVQDSGNHNSLGRIKFNFVNRFDVYLHDTNARSVFLRHNRALSHGCVRVEKPYELAFYCLPEYNRKNKNECEKREILEDKIRHSTDLNIVSKAGKTQFEKDSASMVIKNIRLRPSIPVVFEYYTCFTNQYGEVVFKEDLYDYDKYVLCYLRKEE